jgi:hypothetical protein
MDTSKPKSTLITNNVIEICSNDEFFNENIKYENINIIKISNVSIDDFSLISNFFNKIDYKIDYSRLKKLRCAFSCRDITLLISKNNNKIKLEIYKINNYVLNILSNLPNFINELHIECPIISDNNFYLNNSLTNLPILLEKIIIKIPSQDYLNELEDYENDGYLNVLFGIKIPYKCIVEVSILNKIYQVIYENNDNDLLTLIPINSNKKILIKKVIPYLDSEERKRFAAIGHQYLLQQLQNIN